MLINLSKRCLIVLILAIIFIAMVSAVSAQSLTEESTRTVLSHQNSREILIQYRYDRFENTESEWDVLPLKETQDPWHFGSLGYGQTLKSVKFIARANFAHRYDVSAFQFELDAYPILSNSSYAYLNAGFSDDVLFPEYRFGGEYFSTIGESTFETSVGFRHLSFPANRVTMLTGSLSKYHGFYYLNLRTFYAIDSIGMQWAYFGQIRRYFSDESGYLFFIAGYGPSPDQPTSSETIDYRSAKSLDLGIFKDISPKDRIIIQCGLSNEEWSFDVNKKHFSLTLGYSRNI